MIKLDRFDKETGKLIIPPFYLLRDDSMINLTVFRSCEDTQYAVLGLDTFEKFKSGIITYDKIKCKELTASLDPSLSTLNWHHQYVDSLWNVFHVASFENWGFYPNSKFIGYLSGSSVKDILPKTYEQFQGKREELEKIDREFVAHLRSLRRFDADTPA